MTTVGAAMISMSHKPSPESLRRAAALGYGIGEGEVFIGAYSGDHQPFPAGYRVYLNLWDDTYAGDFPVAFDQEIDEALVPSMECALQGMARLLNVLIVTNDSEEENPIVYLPNGSVQRRFLKSLPDDGRVLPPDLKAFLVQHPQARAA
ncbi:MAG: hypothetical protein QM753_18825 [Thermomicrobiales bacterium]